MTWSQWIKTKWKLFELKVRFVIISSADNHLSGEKQLRKYITCMFLFCIYMCSYQIFQCIHSIRMKCHERMWWYGSGWFLFYVIYIYIFICCILYIYHSALYGNCKYASLSAVQSLIAGHYGMPYQLVFAILHSAQLWRDMCTVYFEVRNNSPVFILYHARAC